jgi:calcium-dependent protein kinase
MIDWPALQEDSRWDTWVNRAFDKLDQNGDGYIELRELESLIGASMRPLYISEGGDEEAERILEARNMLREADTNGDGLVSREEFAELLTVGGTEPDLLFLYDTRLRGGLGAPDVVASVDGDFAVEEEDWRES